ncbi:MAG: LON peptidase substrate-binding domain-containing protein, partial [Saprospiraceae bacterium]|nr:LON peptidase substrate-binding domain-containing protein [Saprospiraceae bacterium]
MRVLPLFPLQLVVFPNEKVNLHIFEPRYKKLIRHCEENSENFGIIPYIKGKIIDAGTELELVSIYNLELDGSCDVELLGKRVFHVVDFNYPVKQDDYLNGKIEFSTDITVPPSSTLNADKLNITSIDPADTATIFGTNSSGDSTLHIRIGNGVGDKLAIESYNGSSATELLSV